jgi:hypothetical protein
LPEDQTYPPITSSLYEEILANKNNMTDLQWEDYFYTTLGSWIHLRAKVVDVDRDGMISLIALGSGFPDYIHLKGVPKTLSINIKKDQIIEFDATSSNFSDFLGTTTTLDDPVIYTIR